MKTRNYNILLQKALFLALIFMLMSCGQKKDVTVIKLGHGLDISHSVHQAMVFMADRLKEKSNGTVLIDIYPNQQLGSERECLELLQIGSLGMTKVSTAVLENFVPSLKVFGLPYLFRDSENRFKVLEGELGERFLDASLGQRLKGLTCLLYTSDAADDLLCV